MHRTCMACIIISVVNTWYACIPVRLSESVNAPNKKETFMSNLLSTKIIVVSILVPVYSHEYRVNHYTYSTCITWYIQ